MAPENVAIIVSISVLGGVIVIALIAVCVVKCVANKKLKEKFAEQQLYGDTVALQNAEGVSSYVHYPAPEPYTPAPQDPEDNPWLLGYRDNQGHEEYNPSAVDALDQPTSPGPHAPNDTNDMPRRPSNAQALQYRPSGVQNIPRRSSYVQDLPRRSSYVQDLPRRSSYVQDLPRRSSYVQDLPRGLSYVQDLPRRSSYVQGLPRRSSYVQDMPRRPSYVQAMPRSRYSYAPDMLRRPSNAQAVGRRPSVLSHAAGRPSRRQSFNRPAQEPSIGQQNKLWYNYLIEEPNYFTQDAIERNKEQPRVWHAERRRGKPSSAPIHGPLQRENEVQQQHLHQQAATRFSWI